MNRNVADIIAEKDALISEIEKLKEDLIAAKRNYDEQIAETKKQLYLFALGFFCGLIRFFSFDREEGISFQKNFICS